MTGQESTGSFGEWLKRRREAVGLTQKELSYSAGCSLSTLRKIESGERRPSRQVAVLLARCLEIGPEEQAAFMRFARGTPEGGAIRRTSRDSAPLPLPRSGEQSPHRPQAVQTAEVAAVPVPPVTPRTNLHASLSSFVGRKAEMAQARSLLWRVDVRLLTLTGPPGVGKTRLASELAASMLGDFADGVFVVPLASITDPDLVIPAVARVLGISEAPDRPIEQRLHEHMKSKTMLLLLDNFEQVLDAAPRVTDLLRVASRLKVVVTSRTPLHVYGEQGFPVPSLPVPSDGHTTPELVPGGLHDSVQLFVRRAQAVRPDYSLSHDDAEVVGEICRRLDGLPLAIELAAARTKHLTPWAVLARLEEDGQLQTLAGGPSDRAARQRTMQEAVAWSYRLLNSEAQTLFCALGVFSGGFTSEAAHAVADTAIAALPTLVDQSLVKQENASGGNRFGLLEVMREYAMEQLVAQGEEGEVRGRHAGYYVALAEEAASHIRTPDQAVWMDRMEAEHSNARTALRFLLDSRQAGQALRMVCALSGLWQARGYLTEGRQWIQEALELTAQAGHEDASKPLRAQALRSVGRLAWDQGDFLAAQTNCQASLALYRDMGDMAGTATTLNNLASIPFDRGDYAAARLLYEEALGLARSIDDVWLVAQALNNLGNLYRNVSDWSRARESYEESARLFSSLGDVTTSVVPLGNLSLVCIDQGDYEAARGYQAEALTICRSQAHKTSLTFILVQSGTRALEQGEYGEALQIYLEMLPLVRQINQRFVLPMCLEGLAGLCAEVARPLEAARLWGAAEALRDTLKLPMPAPGHGRYVARVEAAGQRAGYSSFRAAWDEGRSLTGDAAAAYGLALLEGEHVLRT